MLHGSTVSTVVFGTVQHCIIVSFPRSKCLFCFFYHARLLNLIESQIVFLDKVLRKKVRSSIYLLIMYYRTKFVWKYIIFKFFDDNVV